jgi:hypothetical protein
MSEKIKLSKNLIWFDSRNIIKLPVCNVTPKQPFLLLSFEEFWSKLLIFHYPLKSAGCAGGLKEIRL